MRTAVFLMLLWPLLVSVSSCSSSSDPSADEEEVLARFREAIPDNAVLQAQAPADDGAAKPGDGKKALTPVLASWHVKTINSVVAATLLVLRLRVLGADGSLTGYGGGVGIKRALLALERRQLSLGF